MYQNKIKQNKYKDKINIYNIVIAGSLESANSSILLAHNLFKDFGGGKSRFYVNQAQLFQ